MKTLKMQISGTVQGVLFRQFIYDKAKELEVRGFVRNLEDGRVEVVAEGKDENVNELLRVCRRGSPHSDVKNVEFEELKHQGLRDFKVLRL